MSCAMSQRPFSLTQRTRYLPESTAGAPGGSRAPAGQAKCQRPCSTAVVPLPHTDSARSVSVGGGVNLAREAGPVGVGGVDRLLGGGRCVGGRLRAAREWGGDNGGSGGRGFKSRRASACTARLRLSALPG